MRGDTGGLLFKDQGRLSEIQRNKNKGQTSSLKGDLTFGTTIHLFDGNGAEEAGYETGTSIFDPVLCELTYRWFCPPGGTVLDPFAGGSVRGIVASKLGLRYVGVDLSARQIEANREQAAIICAGGIVPEWRVGDSTHIDEIAADVDADLVFSCPPYGELEVYSDDPNDLSTLPHDEFIQMYRKVVSAAVRRLRPNRFACFVVGDYRGKDGFLVNFDGDTVTAFADAGGRLYNRDVLVTAIGSLPLRAGRAFAVNRKMGKTHQDHLVFVKGDWRKAAEACGDLSEGVDVRLNVDSSSQVNPDHDLYGSGLLGGSMAPKRQGNLAERFMIPPFTILSAREGWWQDRKRSWIGLGIKSELGRGEELTWQGDVAKDLDHHKERTRVDQKAARANANPGGALVPVTLTSKDPTVQTPITVSVSPTRFAAPLTPPPAASAERQAAVTTPALATLAAPANAPQQAPVAAAPRISRVAVHAGAAVPNSAWRPPSELPSLRGIRLLGFDTEGYDPGLKTLGPSVRRGGYTCGISLASDDGRKWYLPFEHSGGDNLDKEKVIAWARDELGDFDGELVGANLIYDLDFVANLGIEFKNVRAFHDVQIAEALLDENTDDLSLDAIGLRYTGHGKNETLLHAYARSRGWNDVKEHMHETPARYVGPYAEADAELPLLIWAQQKIKIEEEDLREVYNIERKLIAVLLAMRRRGVRVNLRRAEEVKAQLTERRDSYLAEARRIAGSDRVELMAPESFAQALADRGLKFPTTPKTGKPSITKAWLQENDDDALVRAIMNGRRLSPIINTFFSGHIQTHAIPEADGYGRVHAQFNQMKGEDEDGSRRGTVARLSSSLPNLQNLPKRDEELGPLTRSVFEADHGEEFGSLDFSQIEWRFLTHYAIGDGAEEARRRYIDDPKTDYYRMAMELAKADPDNKRLRDAYKAVVLAQGYGAGRDKLARMLRAQGLDENEAGEVVDRLNKSLSFSKDTYRKAEEVAAGRGYVLTILKRRQRFPFWAPRGKSGDFAFCRSRTEAVERWGPNVARAWTYKALNRCLQGSAADLMKKAMVDYWEAGLQGALGAPLATVHDELCVSIPRTREADEAFAEARRIMETCIPLKVPVLCKSERGPNWGNLS